MRREDYANFDYVIMGIIKDLTELSRAKTRKSNAGFIRNIDQMVDKFDILKRYLR